MSSRLESRRRTGPWREERRRPTDKDRRTPPRQRYQPQPERADRVAAIAAKGLIDSRFWAAAVNRSCGSPPPPRTGEYDQRQRRQFGDRHHLQRKRVVCTECHEGDFNAGTPSTSAWLWTASASGSASSTSVSGWTSSSPAPSGPPSRSCRRRRCGPDASTGRSAGDRRPRGRQRDRELLAEHQGVPIVVDGGQLHLDGLALLHCGRGPARRRRPPPPRPRAARGRRATVIVVPTLREAPNLELFGRVWWPAP